MATDKKLFSGRNILRVLAGLLGLFVVVLVGVKLLYGGGSFYPDLSTKPLVPVSQVEVLVELDHPPGMVVTAPKGRIFYTLHPFGKPERFTKAALFELVIDSICNSVVKAFFVRVRKYD